MTMDIDVVDDNDYPEDEPDEGNVLDFIDVETIAERMESDDPLVRLEAKLDYVINVSANMADGMSTAMESLQDSPMGRMLGNLIGVNSQ